MKTVATCIAVALLGLGTASAWQAAPKQAAPKEGPEGLTDGQIAAIVVAANQVDINAGELAESKSQNKDVQAFAKQMVTDHTAVNKSATELVQKLHVTPEPSKASEQLTKGGEQNIAKLKTLQGKAFDTAYMDHEVYYHKAVLEELDKRLIPGAQNAELKALLVKVRPAFQAHLEHAEQVQKEVEKSG
jgi:putative membrane protein